MKMYIAGRITGVDNHREYFDEAENLLNDIGCSVLNPSVFPKGFEQEEYMHICYAMIDVCEGIFFLDKWEESKGANLEHEYAKLRGKRIYYESNFTGLEGQLDLKDFRWQSDWNGYEVGFDDISSVGLYTMSNYPAIDVYINNETGEIIEAWCNNYDE